jgi:putative membrane protein insertion efficiency factor
MVVLDLIGSVLTRAALLTLRGYQRVISPCLPSVCRFTPSCSQYMIDAIRKKGLLVGILKGTLRVLRCNPLFRGGHDPVR